MKSALFPLAACFAWLAPLGLPAADRPFYGDPPDQTHPWAIHDLNRPQPKLVTPGTFSSAEQPGRPPSDAIVLFDGTAEALNKWESDKPEGGPTKWIVKDGAMECVPKSGYIRTREQFGDCQLHVEWAAPTKVEGVSQQRGNSGIFLMGLCEVQVLDNYNNPSYADGSACSVYSVNPPLANALRPPGEFQVIDIVFRRPLYQDGKQIDPGYISVFCNGVLVQDHTPLEGPTGHKARAVPGPFPEKGPLKLQDHGNPVRFRNIWYRPLPPRAAEGGTVGILSPAATEATRRETAAALRADAAKLADKPVAQMLRLAESLVYAPDAAAASSVEQMAATYLAGLKATPEAELEAKKEDAKTVLQAFQYLVKFKFLPETFAPKAELDAFVKSRGWDKAK
ncbi:MAG: DUF1080 domain-containing protein [Opitutae bacterium]|nr:DUF1080 domain-containing protein [Opitutae bacterium]